MKAATLFMLGLLVGLLCARQQTPPPCEFALDIEELASNYVRSRTIRFRSRSSGPVSKGSAPAAR